MKKANDQNQTTQQQLRRKFLQFVGLGLAGVFAALLMLPLTGAEFGNLQNALDYIAYAAIVLGAGAAMFVISLPPFLLLWSARRLTELESVSHAQ